MRKIWFAMNLEIDPDKLIARDLPSEDVDLTVKIRYSHPGTPASVTPLENNRARIHLREPQRAVTPGQAAVVYDRDMVLGGGWICRSASTRHPEPRKLSGSKDPAIIPLGS
jgi:tRNA-specific 2-thiouridylase